MKKINELFYSIQGEGRNTGRAATFVRFSGCNLCCPFCDTSHKDGNFYTDEDIVHFATQQPGELVILTGGEPTLFDNTKLIQLLHEAGKKVAVETNGTNIPEWLANVDFITVSPKFEFTYSKHVAYYKATELKVVFDGRNNLDLYKNYDVQYKYLQPCDTGDKKKNAEILAATVAYCEQHPEWRISLQTQKILNVR